MLKLEHTEVFGWNAAIRGMRNPMNSWEKSDSYWTHIEDVETLETAPFQFFLGDSDLRLMQTLSKAGDDHAKFLRMINVTVDITAPLYWWKEFDTYKVGTVANSCSTMHKIHAKEFTMDDFSHEHLIGEEGCADDWFYDPDFGESWSGSDVLDQIVLVLNFYRKRFLKCSEKLKHNALDDWNDGMTTKQKQKEYWWQMIQLLPSSYNQKRTVQLNYQVLKSMYFARRNHKLDEWHTLCEWMEGLPYFKEICVEN